MRWVPYLILVYVLLGLQMGIGGVAPVNLPLLAVLMACLTAPRDVALTAALIVGLGQDVMGSGPPGLYALAYGVVGLVCASRRTAPNHPVMHGALALVAGLIVTGVVGAHAYLRPLSPGAGVPMGALLLTTAVGVVLAPIVLGPLVRLNSAFVNKSNGFHMR